MDPEPNSGAPAASNVAGNSTDDLIVIGVGASAGGLEALGDLLQHLPPGLNLALPARMARSHKP